MTLCDGTGGCVEVSSSYNNLRYIQKQEKNDPDTSIEQFCNGKGTYLKSPCQDFDCFDDQPTFLCCTNISLFQG